MKMSEGGGGGDREVCLTWVGKKRTMKEGEGRICSLIITSSDLMYLSQWFQSTSLENPACAEESSKIQ